MKIAKICIIIISIIIIITFLYLFILYVFNGFFKAQNNNVLIEGLATINNPLISPSGKYQLKICEEHIEGVKHNKFVIYRIVNQNIDETPIFISDDAYRIRDRLFFLWDNDDRVWVYSGDLGTFYWESITDENWEKHFFVKNGDVNPPDLLIKLRPSLLE